MSNQDEKLELGGRLREARAYRGFSQEEVAGYLGVSRSSVSQMESGNRSVNSLELRALARLYECNVDELLGTVSESESDVLRVRMLARATAKLSPEDQSEVLRFAQFLQSRKRRQSDGSP